MDIKALIIFSFGSLLLSIMLFSGILYLLTPEKQPAPAGSTIIAENHILDKISSTDVESDSFADPITLLQNQIKIHESVIDSLNALIIEKDAAAQKYEKDYVSLQQTIENMKKVEDQAKSLAKTFETMKISEIGRSVAKLNDQALMQIYYKMNGRHRKNLLMAVSADRAARLTEKMMSLASE